jgi:proteic killer suppression protein
VIRSFRDKTTEAVLNGESPKGFPADLVRINDQFRACFVWTAEGPAEVEIVDYH